MLFFKAKTIEKQENQIPEVLCGAKLVHINMATGGRFYTSVPNNYNGPCNVLKISSNKTLESIAVLPNNKEARLLAFVAIMPDNGYSEILVEVTNADVTHESYLDWL